MDPATELAWLKVVVKHEALAVRRGRAGVAGEEVDLDAVPAVAQRSVEERLESAERVERSAEVMRRLKRDEARALMLKAEGLSYVEIGERLGWTYTKVNRCITEGRKRFLRLYEELETGAECERLAPVLASLAAGEASAEELLDIRPHLRNCAGVPGDGASPARLAAGAGHRAAAAGRGGRAGPRACSSGCAGRAARRPTSASSTRCSRRSSSTRRSGSCMRSSRQPSTHASTTRLNLRGWVEAALQRLQSNDVVLGVHAAASSGGGRVASIAALIGVCVSGVGAGTYCVATALLPDPKPAIRAEAKPCEARQEASRDTQEQDSVSQLERATRPCAEHGDAQRSRAGSEAEDTAHPLATAGRADRRVLVRDVATGSGSATARTTSQNGGKSSPDGSFESGVSSGAAGGEFSDGTGGEFSP